MSASQDEPVSLAGNQAEDPAITPETIVTRSPTKVDWRSDGCGGLARGSLGLPASAALGNVKPPQASAEIPTY